MIVNKAQRLAIEHFKGPCLVVAGPGSGKTYTITNRIKNLIENYQVGPEEILVITFSKAASLEMKERFFALTNQKVKGVSFGTFHGVFFGNLRWAGLVKNDSILSEMEKDEILNEVLEQSQVKEYLSSEEMLERNKTILSEIAVIKNDLRDIEDYSEKKIKGLSYKSIFLAYEAEKAKRNKIDFEDMILQCLKLFRREPEILKKWQNKFRYLLIDEFQDINRAQYEVVKLLSAPLNNLFVVGDDDQAIYGFRGATPSIMQGFVKDYPETKKITLEINYRSGQHIVNGAGRIIAKNKNRFAKEIKAVKEGTETVHVQEVKNPFEEAEYVVAEIEKALKEQIPLKEIAVLYRTGAETTVLLETLTKKGIPFETKEFIPNIYNQSVARDVFAYIRASKGPIEVRDFLTIMNKPLRYISRNALGSNGVDFERLKEFYQDKSYMCEKIRQLEWDLRELGKRENPYLALSFIRHKIGYDEYLRDHALKNNTDLERLMSQIEELQELSYPYSTFSQWQEQIKKTTAKQKKGSGNALCISSIHGAKGLEYEKVMMIRCNEEVIPHVKAINLASIEEERRLFYVGMTRAKKKLILTYVKEKGGKAMMPSRFIGDLFLSR